jgi:hypothetical protein
MAKMTPESVRLQIAIAFGQGCAGMLVAPAAVDHALKHLKVVTEKGEFEWNAYGLRLIEFSRTVARTSAQLAVGRGSSVIQKADFKEAWLLALKSHPEYIEKPTPYCGELAFRRGLRE